MCLYLPVHNVFIVLTLSVIQFVDQWECVILKIDPTE